MKWRPTTFRRPSGIGLRLLAFTLLVVFVPVAGVLYLDVYEAQLRQVQEAGLAQQARVLAAVLGDRPALDANDVSGAFARLERRSDARSVDGGRVSGSHDRQRSHDRQPREANAAEVRRGRSGLRGD